VGTRSACICTACVNAARSSAGTPPAACCASAAMLWGVGSLLSEAQHCGGSALLRNRHCAPAPKHQRTIRMPAACRPVLPGGPPACSLEPAADPTFKACLLSLRFRAAQEMKKRLCSEANCKHKLSKAAVQGDAWPPRVSVLGQRESIHLGVKRRGPRHTAPLCARAHRRLVQLDRRQCAPSTRFPCRHACSALQLKACQAAAQARAAGLKSQRRLGRPRWRAVFLVLKVTLSSLSVAAPLRRGPPCSHAARVAAVPAPLLANTSSCRVSHTPNRSFYLTVCCEHCTARRPARWLDGPTVRAAAVPGLARPAVPRAAAALLPARQCRRAVCVRAGARPRARRRRPAGAAGRRQRCTWPSTGAGLSGQRLGRPAPDKGFTMRAVLAAAERAANGKGAGHRGGGRHGRRTCSACWVHRRAEAAGQGAHRQGALGHALQHLCYALSCGPTTRAAAATAAQSRLGCAGQCCLACHTLW